MRALELTVYPHVMDGGIDCIIDDEGTMRFHRELDDFAADKRLTDAELAAEYWRKVGDYDACTEGYTTATDGYAYESETAEGERIMAFHRLATLPHYDEADK